MATLKTIYKRLAESTKHMNSGIDIEDYLIVEAFLQAYLREEGKEFTQRWYDEDFDENCELVFRIKDILMNQEYKTYAHALDFVKKPTEEAYLKLLRSFYFLMMSGIAGLLSDTERPKDESESCMLSFFAYAYAPLDEQVLAFKAADYYLQVDPVIVEKMSSKQTLFPLLYHLAKDTLAVADTDLSSIIQAGLERFTFNELYQNAYQGYLSEHQEEVSSLFQRLCDYHQEKSVYNSRRFSEFDYALFQAVPWEVLILLRLRAKKGLDNRFIQHPLLTPFMPFIDLDFPNVLTDEHITLRRIMFADYGYTPLEDLS